MKYNISLQPYNSFGINAFAEKFAAFKNLSVLQEYTSQEMPALILGGGSNILFTKNIEGLVLRNEIPGIEIFSENEESVIVRAGAGVPWHELVMFCVNRNLGGIENLALIPGSTGASPMQNIGAYGVEVKDVFESLDAWHLQDKELVTFSNEDCAFGYRESVFKNKYKGAFVICSVNFRLNKKPAVNTAYGAIKTELENMGIRDAGIKEVARAVMNIRQSKLPDPKIIGNAGSFFKNPIVPREKYKSLYSLCSAMPAYDAGRGAKKLAAGWLIESCGWKGYRRGDAGCHSKQALVLVNYGSASGQDILELSVDIIKSVKEKFGVVLEREVNII
ncbi:MAG: UDP-N-acetylmuramate dehydrogenase [Ferruginibacter sp.]